MKRCWTSITTLGWAVNGASSAMTLSRWATFFRGSPPSKASVQMSRASCSGCQLTKRGPIGTPWRGTSSETGRSAIVAIFWPFVSQTSAFRGKYEYGTR